MDKLPRDLMRLEELEDAVMGLERFSPATVVLDWIQHHFLRALNNLRNMSKDFSQTDLEVFNQRYQRQLELTLSDPILQLKDVIVPIPKGMVNTYLRTLEWLAGLLNNIDANNLEAQLERIHTGLPIGCADQAYVPSYGKVEMDRDKKSLGTLYSTKGLTHLTANHAFEQSSDVANVNELLLNLTKHYYPIVLKLNKKIAEIEKVYLSPDAAQQDTKKLYAVLMDAAYRTSIFATVMNHILDMEHSFIVALSIFKQNTSRK